MNALYWIPAAVVAAVICVAICFRKAGSFFSALFSTRFSQRNHALLQRFRNIFTSTPKRLGLQMMTAVLVISVVTGGCLMFGRAGTESYTVSSSSTAESHAASSVPVSAVGPPSTAPEPGINTSSAMSSKSPVNLLPPEGTGPAVNSAPPHGSEYIVGKTLTGITEFGAQYLMLDAGGTVWLCGEGPSILFSVVKNNRIPIPEPVVKMAQYLFVGKSGTLYLYYDAYKIDPYGAQSGKNTASTLITIPFSKKIRKIVPFGCSDYLLLTDSGEAYTVGEMSLFGECVQSAPLPGRKKLYTPAKLNTPEPLTDAVAGFTRLYALGASGTVYQAPVFQYDSSGEGIYMVWSEEVTSTLPLSRSTSVFRKIPLAEPAAAIFSPGWIPVADGIAEFFAVNASGTAQLVCSLLNTGAAPLEMKPQKLLPFAIKGEKIASVSFLPNSERGLCLFVTEDHDVYASGSIQNSNRETIWETANFGMPEKLPWGKAYDLIHYGYGVFYYDEQGRLRHYGGDNEYFLFTVSNNGLPDVFAWLSFVRSR